MNMSTQGGNGDITNFEKGIRWKILRKYLIQFNKIFSKFEYYLKNMKKISCFIKIYIYLIKFYDYLIQSLLIRINEIFLFFLEL